MEVVYLLLITTVIVTNDESSKIPIRIKDRFRVYMCKEKPVKFNVHIRIHIEADQIRTTTRFINNNNVAHLPVILVVQI